MTYIWRLRRPIGTFYLLAPKLVFYNSDLNKSNHRGATKAIGDLSEIILVTALGNLWLLILNGIALRLGVPRGAEGA
jgi:hypothetical protein